MKAIVAVVVGCMLISVAYGQGKIIFSQNEPVAVYESVSIGNNFDHLVTGKFAIFNINNSSHKVILAFC
jgi:hypothetical protein